MLKKYSFCAIVVEKPSFIRYQCVIVQGCTQAFEELKKKGEKRSN